MFIHLVNQQGQTIVQQDQIPQNWALPTTAWGPGEVIKDDYELAIPPNSPPGQYQIWVGLYLPETFERLTIYPTNTDRILLNYVNLIDR